MSNTYTTTSGVTLSRDAFICHYVAAFLAAQAVADTSYVNGSNDKRPHLYPPVAQAITLAESAWEEIEATKP